MPRYILIDRESGYVMADTGEFDGPARDETPVDACRRFDESIGVYGRSYDQRRPGAGMSLGLGHGAYDVYRAPDDLEEFPPVYDGQDQAMIDLVEDVCEPVATVQCYPAPEENAA